MIDLKDLRQHPDRYRTGAAEKAAGVEIDELLRLDEQLRAAMTRRQELTAEKNAIGKQIGQLAGRIKKAEGEEKTKLETERDALRKRPAALKAEEQQLQERVAELEPRRDALWLKVPQPADAEGLFGPLPRGKSAEDNVEVARWSPDGFDPAVSFAEQRGFEPKSHVELGEALGLFEFERGVKIAGSRSYVLTGDGMRLHQAVLRYAFDTMVDQHGFQPVSVPVLVREQMMVGTGFFPAGRDQAYQIANPTSEDDLVLTGTGEVGLMGLHADEILDADALPLRYVTLSTCFRREAGAAGKDTAGLYRIHQFDKVEQVVICEADGAVSRDWHRRMIGHVEALLKSLGLPYRLLQCCTGDLGPKNADMVDLECWMPSRAADGGEGWGETHSASRLYDYQCRRLNMRYRGPDGKGNVFCHSLNNTVAASPRVLIPLLEMHQQADGSIAIPPPLRPYMGGRERIG